MQILRQAAIAEKSADFAMPRGSQQDNTHCPRFLEACKRIKSGISLLDLGCSGGGLVADFILDKHFAIGIDGHAAPSLRENSEWLRFPHNFFNADISKIFQLFVDNGELAQFVFVTAWEVLEHIHEDDLPVMLRNIRRHLAADGFFVGSISTIDDTVNGIQYHPTIHDQIWWTRLFEDNGLKVIDWRDYFTRQEMPRGSGNPLTAGDWSGNEGFHIMAIL